MAILRIKDNNGNEFEIPAIKGSDGKSAYQIALDNGFEGSEVEWLASLHSSSINIQDDGNFFESTTVEGALQELGLGIKNSVSEANIRESITSHNISEDSHNDIRLSLTDFSTRLNALADSDDTTLDQLSEIVAYIKTNKELIDAVTTSKVSVSDIIDNLTTSISDVPLSAKQGVLLKTEIDSALAAIPTDAHINNLINTALGVIENGSY